MTNKTILEAQIAELERFLGTFADSMNDVTQKHMEARIASLRTQAAAEQPEKEGGAKWGDPQVQAIYELLCDNTVPPAPQHWEGWMARRIVDALAGADWRGPLSAHHPDSGEWQKIETAPKDENVIIFAAPDWVGEARLDQEDDTWVWKWAGGARVHPVHIPTLWRPLPQPPKE